MRQMVRRGAALEPCPIAGRWHTAPVGTKPVPGPAEKGPTLQHERNIAPTGRSRVYHFSVVMRETRAGAVGWEECVTICALWNSLASFPVPRRTR